MKRMRPSPALAISLIALFVALGGTSYAAMTLPANSVGTKQLKNGAVTSAKLNSAVLKDYVQVGGTLPKGKTEIGEWGFGTVAANAQSSGSNSRPVFSFPIPLASTLDSNHVIYVTGSSATHCSGAGHADPGYLCVYQKNIETANPPDSTAIFNPELPSGSNTGAAKYGWGIYLNTTTAGEWFVQGTYAVTAP
jgi:hypothetical protein